MKLKDIFKRRNKILKQKRKTEQLLMTGALIAELIIDDMKKKTRKKTPEQIEIDDDRLSYLWNSGVNK